MYVPYEIRKYYLPFIRTVKTLSYIPTIITRVKNWKEYYADMFGLKEKGGFWIMQVGDTKIRLRNVTVDRWSALENLVLNRQQLSKISNMRFDTIIDAGANIGASIIDFHRTFPGAEIVAIEPLDENIELLKENLKLSKLESKVRIIKTAISNTESDTLKLHLNRNSAESSTSRVFTEDLITVENKNFESLRNYIKGRTLLKIDIEGEEYKLLQEKYMDLLRSFDVVLLETHKISSNEMPEDAKLFFDKNNFKYEKKDRYFMIYNNPSN